MTLLNQELAALAAAIVAELGDDWSVAQNPQGWHGPAHLTGPGDEHLVLHSGWNNQARLKITPVLPPHSPAGERARSITVGETRGAPVIAREITRRLLPGYRTVLARVAAHSEVRRGRFLRRRALAEELAAILGDATVAVPEHEGRTTVRWHRHDGPFADISIGYAADRGEVTIRGVTPDQLRGIAAVLAQDT